MTNSFAAKVIPLITNNKKHVPLFVDTVFDTANMMIANVDNNKQTAIT